MSEYYKSLNATSRLRYVEKLGYLSLNEAEDPYANRDKFKDDMSKWPPVEFGHIFCYYVERPGLYTRKELLQWKSLDGYNYFQSCHVREVKVWEIGCNCSILMAAVNPSQSSPDKAHTAWVAVKHSGDIITCHCTCMAG